MTVYYNQNDPFAAAWLRELMKEGMIPHGEVDERSIADVRAEDLARYRQCHFFAGIGGWHRALELAGWDGPVWTGSCPCQPFSAIGKRLGEKDERHLWPEFRRLIAERRPPTVFGEQVASIDGRRWLSGVRADMEDLGYAVGGADLCSAGVGARDVRQRLYWVATNGDVPGKNKRASSRKQSLRNRDTAKVWWPHKPGIRPVADGVLSRMALVRGGGNAINPYVGAKFIHAFIEVREEMRS